MKTSLTLLIALGASVLIASQAAANLPAQPLLVPTDLTFDFGPYAVQDQDVGPTDPALAKAYDNFKLTAAYNISGICWAGIYAEPLPSPASDTDFIIEIWGGKTTPDLASGALHTFTIEGGATAGTGGADLTVTGPLGHTSPATATSVGGGPAFLYDAPLPTITLAPGDYWISIIADQQFDSPAPTVDPEWQWHRGTGPGNGFKSFDRLLDPTGTPEFGLYQSDKDLAFELKGSLVPEPSSVAMALFALSTIGFIRRRRK